MAIAVRESTVETQLLALSSIRRDGGTQCRARLSDHVVNEYAGQMHQQVEFPPVKVWFDGESYWLSDGFHRLAALEQLGRDRAVCKVLQGSLDDALWDSYCSNQSHGLRRSQADLLITVQRCLMHPNAATLSNVTLAKHLGISEATFRRLRLRLTKSTAEEVQHRTVTRNGKDYQMNITAIGRNNGLRAKQHQKSLKELKAEIGEMRRTSSPAVRSVINIIDNWIFRTSSHSDCLRALEGVTARFSN